MQWKICHRPYFLSCFWITHLLWNCHRQSRTFVIIFDVYDYFHYKSLLIQLEIKCLITMSTKSFCDWVVHLKALSLHEWKKNHPKRGKFTQKSFQCLLPFAHKRKFKKTVQMFGWNKSVNKSLAHLHAPVCKYYLGEKVIHQRSKRTSRVPPIAKQLHQSFCVTK